MRKNISSGTEWENRVGYSRAVRVGSIIEVSGTVAFDGKRVVGENDEYIQTKYIFEKIEKSLIDAGATLKDVVRTRIYLKNISRWNEVVKAHREIFSEIKPTTTMVEVNALISPEFLVEIEATAILNK